MKLEYKSNYLQDRRAEFSYKPAEETIFLQAIKTLQSVGYEIKLSKYKDRYFAEMPLEDKEEFKELMQNWKKAKAGQKPAAPAYEPYHL